jgi:GNAT superfamily N-acetyltransferase
MPARLSLRQGLNIVVLTIMCNSIAILFTTWLATGPYAGARANSGTTDRIAEGMRLPHFHAFGTLNGDIHRRGGRSSRRALMIASLAGYEWRCCRMNATFGLRRDRRPVAADAGHDGERRAGGARGALLVIGTTTLPDHHLAGLHLTGMILAMMAADRPVAGIAAALTYAVMSSGALEMELRRTSRRAGLGHRLLRRALRHAGSAAADRLATDPGGLTWTFSAPRSGWPRPSSMPRSGARGHNRRASSTSARKGRCSSVFFAILGNYHLGDGSPACHARYGVPCVQHALRAAVRHAAVERLGRRNDVECPADNVVMILMKYFFHTKGGFATRASFRCPTFRSVSSDC